MHVTFYTMQSRSPDFRLLLVVYHIADEHQPADHPWRLLLTQRPSDGKKKGMNVIRKWIIRFTVEKMILWGRAVPVLLAWQYVFWPLLRRKLDRT